MTVEEFISEISEHKDCKLIFQYFDTEVPLDTCELLYSKKKNKLIIKFE